MYPSTSDSGRERPSLDKTSGTDWVVIGLFGERVEGARVDDIFV